MSMMDRESEAKEANAEGKHAFRKGQLHCPHSPGTRDYSFWQQGFRSAQRRKALDKKVARAVAAKTVSRDTDYGVDLNFYACIHTSDGIHLWHGHQKHSQCAACGKLATDLLIK